MKTNIIYTCPKCGADLRHICITTYPGIDRIECSKCDWYYEQERQDILRIPFPEKQYYKTNFNSDACLYCSNNPNNGGSGICCCMLGIPLITC